MRVANILGLSSIVIAAPLVWCVACSTTGGGEGSTASVGSNLEPSLVEGAPTCGTLGLGTVFVDDPVALDTTTIGGSFRLPPEGHNRVAIPTGDFKTFDWFSSVPMDAVIGQGPSSANVYRYDHAFADKGLHAPPGPDGELPIVVSVSFCSTEALDGGAIDAGGDAAADAGGDAAEDAGGGTSAEGGSAKTY